MTSARVYVHPRCTAGPALGALAAYLESDRGWAISTLKVVQTGPHRHELAREVSVNGPVTTYQRMDGTTFDFTPGTPAPAPQAA